MARCHRVPHLLRERELLYRKVADRQAVYLLIDDPRPKEPARCQKFEAATRDDGVVMLTALTMSIPKAGDRSEIDIWAYYAVHPQAPHAVLTGLYVVQVKQLNNRGLITMLNEPRLTVEGGLEFDNSENVPEGVLERLKYLTRWYGDSASCDRDLQRLQKKKRKEKLADSNRRQQLWRAAKRPPDNEAMMKAPWHGPELFAKGEALKLGPPNNVDLRVARDGRGNMFVTWEGKSDSREGAKKSDMLTYLKRYDALSGKWSTVTTVPSLNASLEVNKAGDALWVWKEPSTSKQMGKSFNKPLYARHYNSRTKTWEKKEVVDDGLRNDGASVFGLKKVQDLSVHLIGTAGSQMALAVWLRDGKLHGRLRNIGTKEWESIEPAANNEKSHFLRPLNVHTRPEGDTWISVAAGKRSSNEKSIAVLRLDTATRGWSSETSLNIPKLCMESTGGGDGMKAYSTPTMTSDGEAIFVWAQKV